MAAKEIQLHGLPYFLRLLLIRDYRNSVKDCHSEIPVSVREDDITMHVKTFFTYGYNLAECLTSSKRPLTKEKVRSKLGKDDEMYTSILRDVSREELRVWPDVIPDFFNQFARRKTESS